MPVLPPVPGQHAAYAEWQRDHLTRERLGALEAYWRQRLAGAPAALTLPTDRPRPAVRHSNGAWVSFRIGRDLMRALEALGDGEAATLHMVLLGRYAGQDDILVGSPVSPGRREFREVMGFQVNIVVHRGELAGDPTFRALLQRMRISAQEAFAHRDLPIERVIEAVAPERDPGRDPLFQAMFKLQDPETP